MTMILLSFIPVDTREMLRQQYKNVEIDFPPARTPLFEYILYYQYLPRYEFTRLIDFKGRKEGLSQLHVLKSSYVKKILENANFSYLEILDVFGINCEIHINLFMILIEKTQNTLRRLYWNQLEGAKLVICEVVDANLIFRTLGTKASKNLTLINFSEGWWFTDINL
ncbi:8573_t:CDS:2 [Diversispora eburnea]|uniref:8573_t:CDS:1 n=1 Tax=Diversispora eburnea TaxID=1213867 RepID=A0A9N8VF26_9GLOM|nr:8573_t:CDS:2 [Diversispora eburnea]